ncbi:MAG: ATP-binding cassette domain-containing protein [Archaeoglobaceae archaeon]
MQNNNVLLKLENVSKSFGEVRALQNVNLEIYNHEIVGLVGGNGAGKSTLIKIISGVLRPDKGKIYLDGKEITLSGPAQALKLGIYTVHQKMEEMLALHHSVAANIFMGEELEKPLIPFMPWPKILDKRAMDKEALQLLKKLGLEMDSVRQPVVGCSGGQRQATALAKVLKRRPRLLLLDEPTAALGVKEKYQVLRLIKRVGREEGISIIIVSHNLEEICEIVDRIIVLRNGTVVGECVPGVDVKERIVQLIVGAEATKDVR